QHESSGDIVRAIKPGSEADHWRSTFLRVSLLRRGVQGEAETQSSLAVLSHDRFACRYDFSCRTRLAPTIHPRKAAMGSAIGAQRASQQHYYYPESVSADAYLQC